MRLGHADRQHAIAGDDFGQDPLADALGRVGRDHAGLHAGFAKGRHRRDVAGLGDLLEQQRGVEHGEAEAAIVLRHGHAEHADLGELPHVLPGKGAVHVALRIGLELALRKLAHRGHHAPLLSGELEVHDVSLRKYLRNVCRRLS